MKNQQPAFPSNLIEGSLHIAGMTLRDYFSAKAMQALCQDPRLNTQAVVLQAYELADAMIEARGTE